MKIDKSIQDIVRHTLKQKAYEFAQMSNSFSDMANTYPSQRKVWEGKAAEYRDMAYHMHQVVKQLGE